SPCRMTSRPSRPTTTRRRCGHRRAWRGDARFSPSSSGSRSHSFAGGLEGQAVRAAPGRGCGVASPVGGTSRGAGEGGRSGRPPITAESSVLTKLRASWRREGWARVIFLALLFAAVLAGFYWLERPGVSFGAYTVKVLLGEVSEFAIR